MDRPQDDPGYLRTLLELGQTLNATLELSEVLHVAIEQVVQFARAERGFILLVEEDSHRVWGRVTHNMDPVALELALTGRDPENRPQVSRTIIEETLRGCSPIVSSNAMEDPRFGSATSVKLANVRSVLCVPLLVKGRPIGVIYLDNRVKAGVFEQHHVEMVSAFANQAAVAIENARLYENLRKSMDDRLRLQEELHAQQMRQQALEEANRLKTDFVAYVSHELRNPLTTIRGYVQTLQHDDLDDRTRREFYATIEAEADRMLALINELLDSSRLEAGRPLTLNVRRLSLKPLVERVARAARFHKHWTPNHHIRLELDGLPEIEADEDKMLQILTNLLTNAVKFSPNGGEITVSGETTGSGIRLLIADQGVGMNEEQRARLFQRFERVDRKDIEKIPGTGLGLYLTRHLVELHGGVIGCESRPGEGTTFRLELPLRAVREPDAAPAAVASA